MAINKKRILLIHRYFYPDSPPYANMLEDIRQLLIKSGYDVDVLSSQPSYKTIDKKKKQNFITKVDKNSRIIRFSNFNCLNERFSKFINVFWFPILVFSFLLISRKYHVISVGAVPPVILAFFVSIGTKVRGSKLIYHCGDIHPESGRVLGNFKSRLIYNILKFMDNFTCKVSTKIILLSKDMKNSLAKRDRSFSNKIEIINNFDLKAESNKSNYISKNNKRKIIFTGNIGRAQNLDIFILALKKNKPLKNFELVFVGEGYALETLKELANGLDDMVRFIPHQPIAIARKIMSSATMGIVSLQDDIIKYAYPSKTMTYLSEGLPILLAIGNDSELSNFVEKEHLGISVNSFDYNHIYEIYKQISMGILKFDKKHIKHVFSQNFSKMKFDKKYKRLIMKVSNEV